MPVRRGRPPGPSRGRLLTILHCSPWLSSDEAAALADVAPRSVRAYLQAGVADGHVLRHWVSAAPWPPTALYAVAPADGSLLAPRRLARPEHTRALHTLLVLLTAAAGDGWTAALSGEAGGPPPAGAAHPLAGLADGWLVRSDPARGLLVRWDRGDGADPAEGRWVEALLDLGGDAPTVLLVCADDWARQEWPQRVLNRSGRPDLRLCLAADLAAGRSDWRDAWDRPAALPAPARLRPSWLVTAETAAGAPTAAAIRRRLRLTPAAMDALHAVALRPLLTADQVAWAADLAPRTAHAALAELAAEGLVAAVAAPAGPRRIALGAGASHHATPAGLRLLAAAAGLPPRDHRGRTRGVGGRLAPTRGSGSRRLGGLALALAHTRELIALEWCFRLSVERATAADGSPIGLTWRGPACPPVPYHTRDPALAVQRWAPDGAPSLAGRFSPDARVGLLLGERRHAYWIEYDRGTRAAARLAAKLRHAVGWGASGWGRAAGLLVIVPAGAAGREALVHRLVDALADAHGCRRPPLLTTTLDRLLPDRALDVIWWDGDASAGRPALRSLLP